MQENENKAHTDAFYINPYIYPILGENSIKPIKINKRKFLKFVAMFVD